LLVANFIVAEQKDLCMNNVQQITTGSATSIDPLAILIVNEFRASGAKAWLGSPSEAEISQSMAERQERVFHQIKRRSETMDRHYDQLMARTRRVGRSNSEV
jgi:hypothetical protein